MSGSSQDHDPTITGGAGTPAPPIPKRPRRYDASVMRVAAAELAKEVAGWLEQEVDDELIDTLAEALRSASGNGYEMARWLENHCYITPDAYLVEILDNDGLWGAERAAVAAWVAEHGITAPLPMGTLVKCSRGEGEITGADPKQATYTVWNDEVQSLTKVGCGWVVAAEDVTPLVADGTGGDPSPPQTPDAVPGMNQ